MGRQLDTDWGRNWLRGQFASDPFADDALPTWGFWATLVWTIASMLVGSVLAALVFLIWYVVVGPSQSALRYAMALIGPQILAAIALVPQVAALHFAASFKSDVGWQYLGLRRSSMRYLLIGAMVVLAWFAYKLVLLALGAPLVPPRFAAGYRIAAAMHLLTVYWLCIGLIAPVGEEIVFRGFLFRGWSERIGPGAAIVLSSAAWMLVHLPSSVAFLLFVFCFGLVLGWLRWRSGSIVPTIMAHAVTNTSLLVATAATV
jgi:membrane protease YdiL (CAAX protease family)